MYRHCGTSSSPHRPDHTWNALALAVRQKVAEVLVEQQIAHELQLSNVKTGTLAEIGQQADLAVVVGGDGNMLRRGADPGRYDINVIGINRSNLGFLTDLTRTTPCSSSPTCWKATTSPKRFLLEARVSAGLPETYQHRHQRSGAAPFILKVAHMIEFEVYIDEVFAFSQRSDGWLSPLRPAPPPTTRLSAGGPILRRRWTPSPGADVPTPFQRDRWWSTATAPSACASSPLQRSGDQLRQPDCPADPGWRRCPHSPLWLSPQSDSP